MADFSMMTTKMSNTKLKLSDLNPHLMCVLCGGYYIDATTIVECLHSFCRSCIVKHLESSKYCPICEVQVHKTKPLINIRPDKTLQDIVYKLVPGLFMNEMRNRRKFYKERPHYIKPCDSESSGEVLGERKIYINDENITFSLVYYMGPAPTSTEHSYKEFPPPIQNERRYFKCPTGVTVCHLKKLLKAKYELSDNNYKLEIYFKDQELREDFTLLDIAYIYLWKTKGTLDLMYKIFENVVKRQKIEETMENGETVKEAKEQTEACVVESRPEPAEKKSKGQENDEKKGEQEGKEKLKAQVISPKENSEKTKMSDSPKENGVKEIQLQISESGVMSVSQVEDGAIVRTVEEPAAKVKKNEIITGLPLDGAVKGNVEGGEGKHQNGAGRALADKKPAPKPIKPYKTIRCSPKTWHPVIPKEKLRPTLMKNSDEPKKPLKFFKMRNMPRFLGNPSSGVKPMYAEAPENDAEDKKTEEKKPDPPKNLNKILKIDPKTLRPIEKEDMKIGQTPSAPNLLTNPFIPNNNHFLFSDLHLLPPSPGNFPGTKHEGKEKATAVGGVKSSVPNGSYPPICFPGPDHPPGFYPFVNLGKPQGFAFPPTDKMDPLLRASRLSPFGNLAGFNVAGFHASLPPSISRLLNPHHHFRKINQSLEKKCKEESTKETTKSCDDSIKAGKGGEENARREGENGERKQNPQGGENAGTQRKEEEKVPPNDTKREPGSEETRERTEVNGESSRSACKTETTSADPVCDGIKEKDKEKDKPTDKDKDNDR